MDEKAIYQSLWEIIDRNTILSKNGRHVYFLPEGKGQLIKYCLNVIKQEIANEKEKDKKE